MKITFIAFLNKATLDYAWEMTLIYRKHRFKKSGSVELICSQCGWVVGKPADADFVCTPEHLSSMACGAPVTHDCPNAWNVPRAYDEGSHIDYIKRWQHA